MHAGLAASHPATAAAGARVLADGGSAADAAVAATLAACVAEAIMTGLRGGGFATAPRRRGHLGRLGGAVMGELSIRPVAALEYDAVVAALARWWNGTIVVGHGKRYDVATLPALGAWRDGAVVGALTYRIVDQAMEIVTIDADPPHDGTGSALFDAALAVARAARADRVWLVTTNDNLDALRFYQRRGMRLVGLAPGGVDQARVLKPSIPTIGAYGIPLRDELTLELRLGEPGGSAHVDVVTPERDAFGEQ
jgi:ribosomal protein S18 acetylase RimI-like enzyme